VKLENSFTIDAPVDRAWEALNSPETVAPCFPGATLTDYEADSFTGTVKVKLGPIAMTYKGKGTYVTRDEAAREVVIEASGRDSRGNGTASATVTAALAADGPERTAVTMVTDMKITGKPAQFGRGVIADVAEKIIGQFSACVARKLAPAVASSGAEGAVPAVPHSEAISDIATPPVRPHRAAAPAGGSEALSDSVPERSAGPGSNGAAAGAGAAVPGTAPPAATGTPVTPVGGSAVPDTAPPAATGTPVTPGTGGTRGGPVRGEVEAIDLLDTAGAPVLKRLAPVVGGGLLLVLVVLLIRRLLAR
jgi:carbon monoxide dehydrogenase subunit G